MQELLELLVKTVVNDDAAVEIKKEETEKSITFNVTVSSNDIGKVIGKNGRMASSIRTIIKSVNTDSHKKVFVKFGD